jgi:hypothetical protein
MEKDSKRKGTMTNALSGVGREWYDDGVEEVPAFTFRGSKGKKHPPAKRTKNGPRSYGVPTSRVDK